MLTLFYSTIDDVGIEADSVSPARPSHGPDFDCLQNVPTGLILIAYAKGKDLRVFFTWEH